MKAPEGVTLSTWSWRPDRCTVHVRTEGDTTCGDEPMYEFTTDIVDGLCTGAVCARHSALVRGWPTVTRMWTRR